MAEPPAEIHERQRRAHRRARTRGTAARRRRRDRRPAREQERARRADGRAQRRAARPTAKSARASGERAAGTLGTTLGTSTPTRLTATITTTIAATSTSTNGIERRAIQPRQAREGEHRGTDRQRGAAGQRDHAVVPDEHAGRHEPVHREERRHDREAAANDDRARVAAPRTDRHQQHGQRGGRQGADADAVEMHPERRHHHHAAVLDEHEGKGQRKSEKKPNRR